MCNVYVNGSPPFKKKTPNNSHMNVSYLTLIINIFFQILVHHWTFFTANKNTKIHTLGWGMKISIWLSTWSPVGALQNKSNYMKIALRLLYRLRWIFNVHGEYPFSPESCYIKDNQEKRVCFFEHICPWKNILTPALLFENHSILVAHFR